MSKRPWCGGPNDHLRRLINCPGIIIIIIIIVALPADASGVHASTTVVDRGGGTPLSLVGRLASMPVEDAPGGGGRKTNVVES